MTSQKKNELHPLAQSPSNLLLQLTVYVVSLLHKVSRSLPLVLFQTTQLHSQLTSLLLDSGTISIATSRRCWVSRYCISAPDFSPILPHPWNQMIGKGRRGKGTVLACCANVYFTFDRSDWRSNEPKDLKGHNNNNNPKWYSKDTSAILKTKVLLGMWIQP